MSLEMNKTSLVIVVGLILACLLLHCQETHGKKYFVGNEKGWNIYPGLSTWPNNKNFTPGDVLVFRYSVGHGEVIAVDEERAYKECDFYTAYTHYYRSGNDHVVLNSGPNYFISGACYKGLKLKVCAEYDDELRHKCYMGN